MSRLPRYRHGPGSKRLTDRTRKDNAAFFGGEDNVPRHVITMGLGTIMDARVCLLLAFGRKKAAAIAHAVEGPITAMVPASILQMHPAAVVIIDDEAAAESEADGLLPLGLRKQAGLAAGLMIKHFHFFISSFVSTVKYL